MDGAFSPDQALEGSIDDVMIWSTRRTAEQIRSDMDGNPTGAEEDLYLFWDFEQGSGSEVIDRTAGQRNGQLVNMDETAWNAPGRPTVRRGPWNPSFDFDRRGPYEASLRVRSEFGKWSQPQTTTVLVLDGRISGSVQAADRRTPVG